MLPNILKPKIVKRMLQSVIFRKQCEQFKRLHNLIHELTLKNISHIALTEMKKEKALMKLLIETEIKKARQNFADWFEKIESTSVTYT